MDISDNSSVPSLIFPKEEKIDFDEKAELPKRGRSRSLSKKNVDKVDIRAKLERSRQSARECRARKKLRYQYLEEIISETEKAIFTLRRELENLKVWAKDLDEGRIPDGIIEYRRRCGEKRSHTFKNEDFQACKMMEMRIDPHTQQASLMMPPIKTEVSLSPTNNDAYLMMAMGLNQQQQQFHSGSPN